MQISLDYHHHGDILFWIWNCALPSDRPKSERYSWFLVQEKDSSYLLSFICSRYKKVISIVNLTKPLACTSFQNLLKNSYLVLKISYGSMVYCDTCVSLKSALKIFESMKTCIIIKTDWERRKSWDEIFFYKRLQQLENENHNRKSLHLFL